LRCLAGIIFVGAKLFLVEGDALKTWEAVAAQHQGKTIYLLGNLPYNIAATVIATFIEKGQFFERIVVTVQKEVAMRITAKPNQKDYSSLSVVCSSAYNVRPLSILKGEMFYPVPNVDSQSVLFTRNPISTAAPPLPPMFYPLVRALFAHRRKTVQNNLSVFLKISKILSADILQQAHIDPTSRAETLCSQNFLELAALCSTE
jgi:16S rRNA (adenine1518-N6/adenine1519-N6)-dimethyltransferase